MASVQPKEETYRGRRLAIFEKKGILKRGINSLRKRTLVF